MSLATKLPNGLARKPGPGLSRYGTAFLSLDPAFQNDIHSGHFAGRFSTNASMPS